MSIADLGTEDGKKEIAKIFTDQLKFKRGQSGAPIETIG